MHETDTPASGEDVLTTQRHPSGADEVAPHYRAAYGPAVAIPPVIPLPPDSPVGPKARAALARVLVLEEAVTAAFNTPSMDLSRRLAMLKCLAGNTSLPALHAMMSVSARALTDREGYMMDGLVLRDEALRRGFRRGQSCMGPWFETYERRHDGAGVCVVLTFSGNHLPEENLRVALHDLSFTDTGNKAQPKLQLADVPPILLHEAWAESHAIAAAGDGFDPHWEDKAGSQ